MFRLLIAVDAEVDLKLCNASGKSSEAAGILQVFVPRIRTHQFIDTHNINPFAQCLALQNSPTVRPGSRIKYLDVELSVKLPIPRESMANIEQYLGC